MKCITALLFCFIWAGDLRAQEAPAAEERPTGVGLVVQDDALSTLQDSSLLASVVGRVGQRSEVELRLNLSALSLQTLLFSLDYGYDLVILNPPGERVRLPLYAEAGAEVGLELSPREASEPRAPELDARFALGVRLEPEELPLEIFTELIAFLPVIAQEEPVRFLDLSFALGARVLL